MNRKACESCGTHGKGPGALCHACWLIATGFLALSLGQTETKSIELQPQPKSQAS
jgi:hypothetical protein